MFHPKSKMSKPFSLSIPTRPTLFSPELFNWSALDQQTKTRRIFLGCLLLIVSISIYDSYLVAIFPKTILEDERNPICKILIQQDPDKLSWFLAGKFIGNAVVVGTLTLLYWFGYKRVMTVAKGVALFQLGLMTYLTFSDPITGLLHFDGLFSHNPDVVKRAYETTLMHVKVLLSVLTVGGTAIIVWKRNSNKRLCTT